MSRSTRDAEIPADMKHPVSAIVHCGIVSKNVARLNNPINDAAAVAGMLTDYLRSTPLKIKLGLNRLYTRLGAHFVGISPRRS